MSLSEIVVMKEKGEDQEDEQKTGNAIKTWDVARVNVGGGGGGGVLGAEWNPPSPGDQTLLHHMASKWKR